MVISSSQKELIMWICGVILTAASLFGISLLIEGRSPRQPASVRPPSVSVEKLQMLKAADNPLAHNQAKGSGLVEVELRTPAKKPFLNNSTIDLEAVIRSHVDSEELRYAWILPEGVTADAGELHGTLGTLAAGQETTLTVRLVSHTDENRLIHLHVFRLVGEEAMGHMAQFNTVDQDKINDELARKAETLGTEASKGPIKMMQ